MRIFNVTISLFVLFTVGSIYAIESRDTKQCELESADDTFTVTKDIGILPNDNKIIKTEFTWKNTFGHKLTIKKIAKSCSCLIVDPKGGIIEPNQEVTFSIKADVGGWYGNSAVKFVLLFNENPDLRIAFVTKFFVSASLKPLPEEIDFGHVNDPIRAEGLFRVIWVVPPDNKEEEIEFYPNIFSEKGLASCCLSTYRKEKTKSPNTDTSQAIKQDFIFKVYLNPDIPQGEFSDLIKVPVKVDKKLEYIFIPVKGNYNGKVFSSPKSLFWPLQKHDEVSKIILYRQDWCEVPQDLQVTCENEKVKVTPRTIEGKHLPDHSSVPFAEIVIGANLLGNETKEIETNIQIEYEMSGKKDIFNVPVKIISLIQRKDDVKHD